MMFPSYVAIGAVFQKSSDGTNWSMLGAGARTTNGWSLSGVTFSANETIRASGTVRGGYLNGSTWLAEQTLQAPNAGRILVSDGMFGMRSNAFGFNFVSFPGQAVAVDASTNLVDWNTKAITNVSDSAPVYFSDPDSANAASMYYRLRVVP